MRNILHKKLEFCWLNQSEIFHYTKILKAISLSISEPSEKNSPTVIKSDLCGARLTTIRKQDILVYGADACSTGILRLN